MFVDLFGNMAALMAEDKSKPSSSGGAGDAGKKPAEKEKKQDTGILQTLNKLKVVSWYIVKYMVGATNPDFLDDMGTIKDVSFSSYKDEVWNSSSQKSKTAPPGYSVMTFPYTLYYKLQSCVTTNLYEVPAVDNEHRVMSSNGQAGWGGGEGMLGSGEFRISKLLGNVPVLGSILNMIFGNIGINFMPYWDANNGTKTKEPVVTLKFNLFNDSYNAALFNFIFVNTLIPNNKWIQYNMF